ncbi:helix-turn-helix domain-containing protein [Phocaeicola vulgatus]|uniref:helix-turn-helix domain-containing protein n=1 Tax=Phocaeicola vulgatus TaxID=821 RepID=UPI002166ACE2|nr:helix-turn-helix domain-containing protein [Phocaeicola vulgatus]MCS2730127.1 helix-turn-helix domain-containing protein [Phocaeicola vulgatus]
MARRRSITLDQESRVLSLYKDGMAIKEIMKDTEIKSEQTIYRILDSNGVPRRPKVRGVRKIFVTIEEDVAAILNKEQSVSLYVNEAIRFYHGSRH